MSTETFIKTWTNHMNQWPFSHKKYCNMAMFNGHCFYIKYWAVVGKNLIKTKSNRKQYTEKVYQSKNIKKHTHLKYNKTHPSNI